jgi:hypothetical protein
MHHMVRTSDGTLHAFIQIGTQAATCGGSSKSGLLWFDSTDNGATWTCQDQLSSDTVTLMYASATTDAANNIYVVYSPGVANGNSAYDVIFRKLTKGAGSTWTLGAAQTVLDANASTGYSYAVLEKEATNNRLWLAVRYFDGVNYQTPAYYSSDLSDAPTWTQSVAAMGNATNGSTNHYPLIVRFGSKMGVFYYDGSGCSCHLFRSRSDSDTLSTWASAVRADANNLVQFNTPNSQAVGTADGKIFLMMNEFSGSVFLVYFNGQSWTPGYQITNTAITSGPASLSTDGINVWLFYGDTTGLSGLSGNRKLVYKKCAPPYGPANCDPVVNVNSYQDIFNQVWLHDGSTYENLTTGTGDTTTADVKHSVSQGLVKNIGDTAYFGQTTQFDSMSWLLSTVGTVGVVTWEYCSAVDGSSLCTTWSPVTITGSLNSNFVTGSGWVSFTPPGDWVAAKVNSDSQAKYYVRFRATTGYTVLPVATQFVSISQINWADFLPSPVSNTIYGMWTENAASPTKVRSGSVSVTTNSTPTATTDLTPVVGYSSFTNATQPSTMKHMIKTSDGTIHAFIQAGTMLACGNAGGDNSNGLNWIYSTNDGSTWTCGGQLSSDLTNVMYASVTSDASDNLYVVYSTLANGAGTGNDIFYRKFTYNGSSSWTMEAPQTVLDGTAGIGYTYGVVEKEATNSKLWLAVRYYDGVNYQVSAYYSSDLTTTPTWTQSSANLDSAGTQSNGHFPTIAKFGSKIGIIYTNNGELLSWRFRADADALSNWVPESVLNSNANVYNTFYATGTPEGNLFVIDNLGGAVFLRYFDGNTWLVNTVSTSTANGTFVSLATDGTSVWVIDGESTGLSGSLSGSRKLSYRKCVPPYGSNDCDLSYTNINTYQDTFNKVWSYIGSSYADITTQSSNTTTADVTMPASAGDLIYFGKSAKFDAISYVVSTNSVGGALAWEYWNGVSWTAITSFISTQTPNFNGNGYLSFSPHNDWATTTINSEGTAYYYIRASVYTSFTTPPVGTQFVSIPQINWAYVIPSVADNTLHVFWTENATTTTRVRTTTVAATMSPNLATSTELTKAMAYSSSTGATQPSTMDHLVRTSDGTLHAFIQAGTMLACGGSTISNNNMGLNWIYSIDNGTTWVCGGQLSSDTTNQPVASAVVDSSDNIYVVYSVVANGGSSSYDVHYRKLTYNGSASWTLGAAQTVADSILGTTGYSYATLVLEGNSRIWMATRYYTGTNYQVVTYYSDNLSDAPTWTISQAATDIPDTSNVKHYPRLVRYGTNVGVIYADDANSYLRWRHRSDTDDPTTWTAADNISTTFSCYTASFTAITDIAGHIYLAASEIYSGAVDFTYFNGFNWSDPATITLSSYSTGLSLVTDNTSVWVVYREYAISGDNFNGTKVMYKRGVAPFATANFDLLSSQVVPYYGTFDKVWTFLSSTYNDETIGARTSRQASGVLDINMPINTGDMLYLGKLTKFDTVTWGAIGTSAGGEETWEYWNGSAWVSLNKISAYSPFGGTGGFNNMGTVVFTPNDDWVPIAINTDSVPYYYVRARTLANYTGTPTVGAMGATTVSNWFSAVLNPSANNLYTIFSQNWGSPIAIKFASMPVSTNSSPPTITTTPLEETNSGTWWWNTDWRYRKSLSFNNTSTNLGVTSDTLTDFPVMVNLTATNFDFTKTQGSGQDLRFLTSDNQTQLAYEIEKWDTVNKKAIIWVKIPQIDANTDSNSILMYYGNPLITDNQSPAGTWDNNFISVWHLNADPSVYAKDSSRFSNTLFNPSGLLPTDLVTGKVGDGINFVGTDNTNADTGLNGPAIPYRFAINQDFTVSGWVNTTNTTSWPDIFTTEYYGPRAAVALQVDGISGGNATFRVESTCCAGVVGTKKVNDGTWHFITGVRSGDLMYIYVDGLSDATPVAGGSVSLLNAKNATIGKDLINWFPAVGGVDEVRVSTTARSPAWIAADYKTGNDQFVSYGAEEIGPATVFNVGNNMNISENNGTFSISGSFDSNSSGATSSLECSVNDGPYQSTSATDGSFDSHQENFNFNFHQNANGWTGDGYTLKCRVVGTSNDRYFYFSPLKLDGPSEVDLINTTTPAFDFTVNKQSDVMKSKLSKYQIWVRRGDDTSKLSWQKIIDDIPINFASVKSSGDNLQRDVWGNLDVRNGVFETKDIYVIYSNDSAHIKVRAKNSYLAGTYQWKVVAVTNVGNSIDSGSNTIYINGDFGGAAYTPFPLAVMGISGTNSSPISTWNVNKTKSTYSTNLLTPSFYGIAWANSKIKLTLFEQNCVASCIKTYTTTVNPASRFGIVIPKGDLISGKKYYVRMFTMYDQLYNELPQFTLSIGKQAIKSTPVKKPTPTPTTCAHRFGNICF